MAQYYEKTLNEAYYKLPSKESKHERIEVSKPINSVFGSKSILHKQCLIQGLSRTNDFISLYADSWSEITFLSPLKAWKRP